MSFAPPLDLSASSVLCLALLHFVWQGAVVAVIALPIASAIRRLSPRAEYTVQLAALLLMPIAFLGTIGWLCLQRGIAGDVEDSATVAAAAAPITVVSAPAAVHSVEKFQATPPAVTADINAADNLPPASATQPVDAIQAAINRWLHYSPWGAALYFAGVLFMLLRLLLGLGGARRLARCALPIDDDRLLALVARQCRRLGLHAAPLVAYSREVAVPTVIGILRPTILLPLAVATGLTPQELESILIHELVHIRRHDQLWGFCQRVVEAAFFFHPAVWVLSRRISAVREHCCDDRVIALGAAPQVYIESLLRVAELSLPARGLLQRASLAALFATGNPSQLRERISRLIDQPVPVRVRLKPTGMLAFGVLLVSLATTPFAVTSFAQRPVDEPPGPFGIVFLDSDPGIVPQPVTATAYRGQFGEQFDLEIIGRTDGTIWGTDVYTDDSDISTAAVHAGIVQPGERALVTVTIVKPRPSYRGDTRNDVTSHDFGPFPCSFILQRKLRTLVSDDLLDPSTVVWANALPFRQQFGTQFNVNVVGSTAGTIWGTDVYTDDSSIAMAAVHAGLVEPGEQAVITVTIVKSPARHTGSARNGVTSLDYGSFPSSFILQRNRQPRLPIAARSPGSVRRVPAGPINALAFVEQLGARFDVQIVGRKTGQVWGTEVYTADSDIATAAVHAGLVKANQRATVTVTIVRSPGAHAGSSQNGVTSQSFGRYQASYILQRKADTRTGSDAIPGEHLAAGAIMLGNAMAYHEQPGLQIDVSVVGQTTGNVWGTEVYTADSDIAAAAVHAGVVQPGEQAVVTVTIVRSPATHEGSARNGVTSGNFGSYSASYILTRKKSATLDAPTGGYGGFGMGFGGGFGGMPGGASGGEGFGVGTPGLPGATETISSERLSPKP